MSTEVLDRVKSPADLAQLSHEELDRLAFELRAQMVAATSLRGGHLAPSLGATELIIALHRCLECPEDKIVFDVGHQAYAHKLLTGRKDDFMSLRTKGGISGFPKMEESPFDAHASGHASDSLSIALGYALARDMDGKDSHVAAVIGDASFAGGMALEALNEIGQSKTKIIVILNDNGMSISKSVGGFASFLGKMRLSDKYTKVRDHVEESVNAKGKSGRVLMEMGNIFKDSFKQLVVPGAAFFEGFGVTYIGPVDGHDIPSLEEIISEAKNVDGPVLIHAVTTKGKGYSPAEERPDLFHGVGPFDVTTGLAKSKSSAPSWTSVFSDELVSMASEHEDIVAITAAMPSGTGLVAFSEKYPERFIDAGIAEESAVGISAALASSGKVPFVAIYSTFMQRAFDQIMINVALQKRHVVFCLDRAGIVGEDGPTHHGAFDLSYMRNVPGMTILAPSTDQELRDALRSAYAMEGPVCIRYHRGAAKVEQARQRVLWTKPEARKLNEGTDVALLAVGPVANTALEAARLLAQQGISASVYDMRWVKPLDTAVLEQAAQCGRIFTIEENSICGGFGSACLEALADAGLEAKLTRLGLPDGFTGQGKVAELLHDLELDAEGIAAKVKEVCGE